VYLEGIHFFESWHSESQLLTDKSAFCYRDEAMTTCRRMRSGVFTILRYGYYKKFDSDTV